MVYVGLALNTHASPTVSLVFAGDIVLDDTAGELIAQGGDPFAPLATYLKNADIRIANLECVVSIRAARQQHQADLVIPIMHWGWENERQANPRQRFLAQRMVDAGADAVIGCHPHVTQDIAIYKGKPIVFSVGNFVMKETDNAYQRQGWLLKLYLDKRGVTGFETLPVNIDLDGLPTVATETTSPCWTRGDKITRVCDPRK